MAIKKSFGGQSIRKPGAYSRSLSDPTAGVDLQGNETVLLIGEAEAGPGGSVEGIQFYSASALSRLISKYRSGPIVDAAKVALAPSRTPGVGGAGRLGVYKTNNSLQSSLALANSYGSVESLEYSSSSNRITIVNSLSAEVAPSVVGSAAVTNFAGLDGLTLELRSNGGAVEEVTFSTPANIGDVISQIEAQTTDISVTQSGAILTISKDVRANGHRDGWGQSIEVVGGDGLSLLFLTAGQFGVAASEQAASITLSQPRDSLSELDVIGGDIAMSIGRDDSDSCTAATVQINATNVILTATGSTSYTFAKADYPFLKDLKAAIEAQAGWSITMSSTLNNQLTSSLDQVAAIGAFSEAGNEPARIKRDLQAVKDFFEASNIASLDADAVKGLPDALLISNLSGGAKGASATSAFSAGMDAALAHEVNVIVPLVSQDASADISDGDTDASSTYDVESVHAALDTHLRLRGSIKNRKEAQGVVGYRKALKADVFEQAASLNSELIQLCSDDVLVIDSSNELTWKKPHIFAAMIAGARVGTEIGEPLTHKYFAVQGAGHYVNSSTGAIEGDFNALVDFDEAIDSGVTFLEPANGSYRLTVDNTTYGIDANFIFNRGSVVEDAQYIAKEVRRDAELAFVGRKNAVIDATAIKNRVRAKLIELFENRITSASDDAPQGYREDSLIVTVTGNTAEIEVEVKPVQGLDFVFIIFTLGETRQSA